MTIELDPNCKEVIEIKSALEKADREKGQKHVRGAYPYAEIEYARQTTLAAVERIRDTYARLRYYYDSEYKHLARPALFWPDGSSLGFGWASHVMGTAQRFYRTFEYWGFRDLTEFYSLPRPLRNQFMDDAATYWKRLFGEKGEKLVGLLRATGTGGPVGPNPAILDLEHTLRAGLACLARLIKEEARKEGWDDEKSR